MIKKLKNKKIGVLCGGWSSEREISLKSGNAIYNALKKAGCRAVKIDIGRDCINKIKESRIDVAFIALHGSFGEDGTIQAMLESQGIPYTGSGVLASALAMNKIYSKKIFEWHKLPTPKWTYFNQHSQSSIFNPPSSNFPLVVKPSCQGSTVGISIIKKKSELRNALRKAFRYDGEVLIEEFIKGREMTVGILGGRSLPVLEIIPVKSSFYDYKAKYSPGGSRHIIPAEIPGRISAEMRELAIKAFDALGCRGMGRVDIRLRSDNKPFILEVNTIPGMTEVSLLPEAAQSIGISFEQLVLKILEGT